MIPHPASALTMLSGRLMEQLLPDLKSEYNVSDGMLIAVLMNALAREVEFGIDVRLQDIREMQQLFEAATAVFRVGRLPAGLESLVGAEPDSLTLEAVNGLHDSMTGVLIKLHESVDGEPADDAARLLNDDIWAYLERQALRHQITAAG